MNKRRRNGKQRKGEENAEVLYKLLGVWYIIFGRKGKSHRTFNTWKSIICWRQNPTIVQTKESLALLTTDGERSNCRNYLFHHISDLQASKNILYCCLSFSFSFLIIIFSYVWCIYMLLSHFLRLSPPPWGTRLRFCPRGHSSVDFELQN